METAFFARDERRAFGARDIFADYTLGQKEEWTGVCLGDCFGRFGAYG